jgi:hypothetical protein
MVFDTFVQREMTYERTITPDPPFNDVFPPDVKRITPQFSFMFDNQVITPDTTKLELQQGQQTIPIFDLSRADGRPLDGWNAYLRDATTKRPISPVKALSGPQTPDSGLLLPISHHPPPDPLDPSKNLDPLINTELVMAPPAGQENPMPTFVVPLIAMVSRTEIYPLPAGQVKVPGSIAWSDEHPVSADIVFVATGIYAAPPPMMNQADGGSSTNGGGAKQAGDGGLLYLLYKDGFEYMVHARAEPDLQSGTATYSINLPRGEYRVIVRPLDGGQSETDAGPVSHALTIVQNFDTGLDSDPVTGPKITVGPAPTLSGKAWVADQRPLSGATVEALPIRCALFGGDAGAAPIRTPDCMPRYAQTITDPKGAFTLALDAGEYVLRVEPVDGTRLPWVWKRVQVPSPSPIIEFSIPAPVYRELQLFDQDDPLANAIVRMFTMPAVGPAVEIGRAMTDEGGHFAMYLDPAVQ